MRRDTFSVQGVAAALILAGASIAPAQAAFIATVDGNDCAGVYGQGFSTCVLPADPANGIANDTPIVVKFNFGNDGNVTLLELNPAYSSIDGSEFSFDFGTDGNTGTGTWTYAPGAGDPSLTAFVAKGGNSFNLFSTEGNRSDVAYYTPVNGSGGPAGLSHLSFYDSGDEFQVPEPGTLVLLGLGLIGIVVVLRRNKAP